MIKVRYDDQEIQAKDAIGVVEAMQRQSMFDQGRSLADFMLKMAVQSKTASGKDIRATNPKEFIDDLIKAGLLEKIG
jgi:hypothetical protein